MAKGEASFGFGNKEKKRYSFEPFSARDCDLKLLGESIEIRKSQNNPESFSRVSCAFLALGTADEGGKDKRVFHDFYVRLKEDKNGVKTVLRADQIKGFADGVGKQPDFPLATQNGEKILSPQAVVKWLKSFDGEVVRGHVRVKAGSKDYPEARNVISEFFDAEESSEDEESADADEELEEGDDVEADEDADEEVEDDDLAAAAKKKSSKKSKR